jgi:hypothetical protein
MISTFNATFNVATRTDATPPALRPVSGSSSSGFTSDPAAPAMQDTGRGARLAYRLIATIGGIGR